MFPQVRNGRRIPMSGMLLKKNFKNARLRRVAPTLLLVCGLFLYFGIDITNKTAPGGDGGRIHSGIAFSSAADSLFPLWNPYKLGGIPVLADPERFTPMGYITSMDDPYRLLKINIVLISLAFGFSFSVFLLSRVMGLDVPGAALAAFIMTTSQSFEIAYLYGRLIGMINLCGCFLTAAAYLHFAHKPEKRIFQYFFPAISVGYALSYAGYYALVMPIGFLYVLAIACQHQIKKSLKPALLRATLDMIAIGLAGITLFSVFIVPLFSYQFSNGLPASEGGFNTVMPESFMNLFFPVLTTGNRVAVMEVYPFTSLLLLPGIAMFISAQRQKNAFVWASFAFICGAGLVTFLDFPGLSWLKGIYVQAPILSGIRHVSIYYYPLVFALVYICVLGLRKKDFDLRQAVLFAVCVLGAGFLLNIDPTGFFATHKKIIFGCSALSVFFLVLFKHLKNKEYIIIFILLVQIFAIDHNIGHENRRSYKTKDIEMIHVLQNDKDYFRLYCLQSQCPPNAAPHVQGLQGFSLYFSPEHRRVIELFQDRKSDKSRPHWDRPPPCDRIEKPQLLEMLNIKYVQCAAAPPPGNWVAVANHKKNWMLYQNEDWRPALRLFGPEQDLSSVKWPNMEQVWVTGKSDSAQMVELNENSVEVVVQAEKDSILYLPEYYDSGWRAYVDGKETPVLKLFGIFRGAAVPAGQHHVLFVYRPLFVTISFALSCMAWVLALLLVFRGLPCRKTG